MAIEKMNKLETENNYYLSLFILTKKELKAIRNNYIYRAKQNKLIEELLYKLKKECFVDLSK